MARTGRVLVGAAVAAAGGLVLRDAALHLGATQVERSVALPGDGLLPDAHVQATRGITIPVEPAAVWPWLVQIGWQRGGFYSYDALENLVGLDIRSADEVVPAWQDLALGDHVHLAPEVALEVVVLEPAQALVIAATTPPGEKGPAPYDCTWAFVLRPGPDVGTTRLVTRERYVSRGPGGRALIEAVSAVSTLMSERMLRGIRDRAAGQARDA